MIIIFKGRELYIPCRNDAQDNQHFVINVDDYAKAEEKGAIVKIVHSHPDSSPQPSTIDKQGIEESNLPWIICNPQTEEFTETLPENYKIPLIGRSYELGKTDCYSLIRDYYRQKCSIFLPDYEYEDRWWEKGKNLYLDNFMSAGFRKVDDLQLHDGIIFRTTSKVPNHAGVYLGDGIILHHPIGRLSGEDIYGGYWLEHTYCIVRHLDLFKD